jgi:Xaa-Pro aminopeptidase
MPVGQGAVAHMKTINDAIGNVIGLQKLIDTGELDAVIAVSPENVRYIADVEISTQRLIRDRLALIVWAKGHEPVMVLCQVEEGYARQESWIGDIRGFKEFVTPPMRLVADVLREKGLAGGRVGCELEYLAGKYIGQLQVDLPQLRLEPCEGVFRRARMIKSARERETMRRGFRGTERALQATYLTIAEGEDECSLHRRLSDGILRSGAEDVAFCHINAGPNTGFPHAAPTGYRAQAGDIVKADCGGHYSGYFSNVGRTAKLGKPSADEADTWKRLREIHHAVARELRPGKCGRELFELAGRLHDKHQIPLPYAHNGHSIGLEVHEHPFIGPHEEVPFEPGMVCTVETRVRWVGRKGLHMEDLFEITSTDPVLMSDAFDNEEILVI